MRAAKTDNLDHGKKTDSLMAKLSSERLPDSEIAPTQAFPESTALGALLLCSIAVWFFAIKAPFWIDETVSYWQIAGGFWKIWDRQEVMFPAYSYILWTTKFLLGSSEIALRVPSIMAMLGAVYSLYLAARELFSTAVALVVTIAFCAHPSVIFAAIDARPYAFALLMLNLAILSMLRWLRTGDSRYAIAWGAATAGILYFQYLFVVIVPAFLLLLVLERKRWADFRAQAVKAVLAFAIAVLPVLPGFTRTLLSRQTHVFSHVPNIDQLIETFAPGFMLAFFVTAVLAAAAFRKLQVGKDEWSSSPLSCVTLGLLPLGILYAVSTFTATHVFVERYCLVAVPGIALCWGLLLSQLRSPVLRFLFGFVVVAYAAQVHYDVPTHGQSWKPAVDAANNATESDQAPVLVCSDLIESNYRPIPPDIDSTWLYAPLSYYHVKSPVVPLPRSLDAAAEQQMQTFLTKAPQRFLIVADTASSSILDWLETTTKNAYRTRPLGTYDGVDVVEYDRLR